MIPLRDDNPRQRIPYITVGIIIANVMVFIYQLTLPAEFDKAFVMQYGAIPVQISHGQNLYSIFSSMFLHGGLFHIAGNMLYLYIFGDNIESILGHFRFFIFYLVCGALAFLSHYIFMPFSPIPMIGASGAISGVLGAYARRFPRARVMVLVPLFIWIWRVFHIPAVLVLGFWFIMQLMSGFTAGAGSGVAWFAHIGGFIAGIILIKSFDRRPVTEV